MPATVTGLSEVRRGLRKFDRDTRHPIRRALERVGFEVQAEAKRRAPVHMGRLRSAIQTAYDSQRQAVIIGAAVHYAKFVEFGVGPAGASSEHNALAEAWMREAGYVHGSDGPFPPIDIIRRWVHLNGIADEGEDEDAVAFLIARSIARNGIAAQPFLFPALMGALPKVERYVALELRRELNG